MKKSIERLKEIVDHPPRKQTRRADVGSNSEKTVSSEPNIQRTGSPKIKVRKSRGRNCHWTNSRKCVSRLTAPTEIPACEKEYIHNQRGSREGPKYYQGLLDTTVEAQWQRSNAFESLKESYFQPRILHIAKLSFWMKWFSDTVVCQICQVCYQRGKVEEGIK